MNRHHEKLVILVAGLMLSPTLLAQDSSTSMGDVLQKATEQASKLSRENAERVSRFERERNNQNALLRQARADLAAEERRSEQLKTAFDDNELLLEALEDQFRVSSGNLGEMFGVVRQVAGDVKGTVDASLISAQYPDRGAVAARLAQIKGLPSIEELNELRVLMLNEMVESGRIVRYPTQINEADGSALNAEVVRVGAYNLISGDRFLSYSWSSEGPEVAVLPRQPQARYQSMAEDLFDAAPGSGTVAMAVDPSFGSLLNLLIDAPTFQERIDQGGLVGYAIIALGLFGILIAIWRMMFLSGAGSKIRKQLKSDVPDDNNALGRILSVYHQNKDIDTETLELKLDEAILKETPVFEKWQGLIKVFAAIAPLMGLLGTVVGMIATFQAITLFGTGDPKLMAGGISQALVTTVLGLVAAIPLVLLHSIVAAKSRTLVEILEEQSAGLIARHSEKEQY